jgi:hypothetical protein
MVIVGDCELLADAEIFKHVVKGILRGNLAFAGDFGKVGEDETKVFRDNIATKIQL